MDEFVLACSAITSVFILDSIQYSPVQMWAHGQIMGTKYIFNIKVLFLVDNKFVLSMHQKF